MNYSLIKQYADAGRHKCKNGLYNEAEQLFTMALNESQTLSSPNAYESQQLKTLGIFYFALGRFSEAEPLLMRSLEIEKALLGPNDLEIGKSYNHLGLFYHINGQFSQAEQAYKTALTIVEKAPYQKKPSVDAKLHHLILHLLAMVYCSEGKKDEAFTLCKQASDKIGKFTGPGGKDLSMGIHDVAVKFCDNDPNPEVQKTCGWLLHVFLDQLQTEFLGSAIETPAMKYREIVPQKGMFAPTHEMLAAYDEAWRPAAIYRNETLPGGYRQTQPASLKVETRRGDRLSEIVEEEWRP